MTDALQLVRRLHEHRQWANHQLLEVAQGLTDEQLRASFEIGQGSIWRSLLHLYAAEYVWLEALRGNEDPTLPGDTPGGIPGNQEQPGAIETLGELATRWSELDEEWREYLQGLGPVSLDAMSQDETSLDEMVYKFSTSSGRGVRHGTRRADVLLHVCTHAQYTTAQVMNMLRHCGAKELPDPMLITLARRQQQGANES